MGIHRERRLPGFPDENFPDWAKKRGRHRLPTGTGCSEVVYFAGRTASYLYPEVARAAVSLLQAAGVQVWVPPLDCCGMPPLLEGDRRLAGSFARKNLNRLARAVEEGFDIVCSCPTCVYVFVDGAFPSAHPFSP